MGIAPLVAVILWVCLGVTPVWGAEESGDGVDSEFAVDLPEGWEVRRNRRFFGNSLLVMTDPNGLATITIEWMREGRRSRALPLRLVSDTLALNLGRKVGVEAELFAQHQIDIAGWEAWVTTAMRRSGPHARVVSVVVLRVEDRLAVLTLHCLPGKVALSVPDWQLVLDSFSVPGHAPPEFRMEDLILIPPEEWTPPSGG